jgi:hypothetical protein
MLSAINEWMLAVVAANEIAGLPNQSEAKARDREQLARYEPLLEAAKAWQDNPTNWKAYVAWYEAKWIDGHPGTRGSIKDFQKLTPEKKAQLEERARRGLDQALKRRDALKETLVKQGLASDAERSRLEKFLIPGVSAIKGQEISKDFPIDLTGWKYDERKIQQRLERTLEKKREETRELIIDLKQYPDSDIWRDMLAELERKVRDPLSYSWKSISVTLSLTEEKGYRAFWQGSTHHLKITLPHDFAYELKRGYPSGLSRTLRHELQHFAQDYLGYTLGKPEGSRPGKPGLPSRKILTPEYEQHRHPNHPSYRSDDPDTKSLYQRLKQQGVDPRRINFHDLDDVEFYTELADAIDIFKTRWQRVRDEAKPGSQNIAIKLFTGVIPTPVSHSKTWYEETLALGGYDFTSHFEFYKFFAALRSGAPGKYRKALSEFVKAVT